MRVRQLVNGDRRASGTLLIEVFSISLVIPGEIIHRHEVGGNFDDVSQIRMHAGQNIADVLDDSARLHADIEAHLPGFACFRTSNGVVRAARAGARHEQIVARALDVRKSAAGFGFAFYNSAFHRTRTSGRVNRQGASAYCDSLMQILFSSE
jgi:hypothetical protein